MHFFVNFVEDDSSLEMAQGAILLGGLAILGLIVVLNGAVALSGLWSSQNANAVLANTLG